MIADLRLVVGDGGKTVKLERESKFVVMVCHHVGKSQSWESRDREPSIRGALRMR